ncbi:MAG: hypothetical protein AB1938_18960 [Myxococcota bacterium]
MAAALLLGSGGARAEAAWLTARGRLLPQTRLEAWGGVRSVGVGLVRPDHSGARAGWAVETLYAFPDRTLELRGSRQWQFSKTRTATGSATLGVSSFIVPVNAFDLGIGPHAGLNLGIGGGVFTVDFGLQTGVEVFLRQDAPRFPQRALIGFNFQVGQVSVSAMARAGFDLIPGHYFVGRGEFMLSVGWLDLDRYWKLRVEEPASAVAPTTVTPETQTPEAPPTQVPEQTPQPPTTTTTVPR